MSDKAKEYLATSVWKSDLVFTKAKGSYIWLNDKPYLDFATGPGVANVGHNHPEVIEAVKKVLENDEAGYGGNILCNKYQIELAEKLCELTPGKFPKRVFFSNSGGEAVEAAILACMKRRPERKGMVSFLGDFHGRLGFCRTATTSRQLHVEGLPWGMARPFFLIFPASNPERYIKENIDTCDPEGYLDYVGRTIGPFIKEINFALFELVQGEGGINVAEKENLQALIDYLKKNGVWIIIDEVQTGLGRTGRMWASELFEVEPDIITVAKALSGGAVPIAATIMREELSFREPSEHCNTFGGGALACAAGLKVLEIMKKENLSLWSGPKGSLLRDSLLGALDTLYQDHKIPYYDYDISGCGLMSRISFKGDEKLTGADIKNQVIKEAFDRGLFLMSAGEQSIRLMPPLNIANKEIEKAIGILFSSVRKVYSRLLS